MPSPWTVIKQARSESGQVAATDPEDRTLHATRDLLSSMFLEYSRAVALTAKGGDAAQHMANAWRLANSSHKLLAGAQAGLAAQGCDVSPLLSSHVSDNRRRAAAHGSKRTSAGTS